MNYTSSSLKTFALQKTLRKLKDKPQIGTKYLQINKAPEFRILKKRKEREN